MLRPHSGTGPLEALRLRRGYCRRLPAECPWSSLRRGPARCLSQTQMFSPQIPLYSQFCSPNLQKRDQEALNPSLTDHRRYTNRHTSSLTTAKVHECRQAKRLNAGDLSAAVHQIRLSSRARVWRVAVATCVGSPRGWTWSHDVRQPPCENRGLRTPVLFYKISRSATAALDL